MSTVSPALAAVTIIMQARMTSTRLPGKVLMPIMGKPMMLHQIERLRRLAHAARLVVATTVNATDDAVAALCAEAGVPVTRGPEHDVLGRYEQAMAEHGGDTIVRVTADCPMLDPSVVDAALDLFAHAPACDYLSNGLEPSYPLGMGVEVARAAVLKEAAAEARDPYEREHVTAFIYRRPQRYVLRSLKRGEDLSTIRWTVDTSEDFDLVRRLFEALLPAQPDFTLAEALACYRRHPDWAEINAHVQQR